MECHGADTTFLCVCPNCGYSQVHNLTDPIQRKRPTLLTTPYSQRSLPLFPNLSGQSSPESNSNIIKCLSAYPSHKDESEDDDEIQETVTATAIQILLNVENYTLEELNVVVTPKYILVSGEHKEKLVGESFLTSSFTRKLRISNYERKCSYQFIKDNLICDLSNDGLLQLLISLDKVDASHTFERELKINLLPHLVKLPSMTHSESETSLKSV